LPLSVATVDAVELAGGVPVSAVAQEAAEQGLVRRVRYSGRLGWLAVRLAWRASPKLLVGIVVLLAVEAALAPVQLTLSQRVIDRVAELLGAPAHASGSGASLLLWIGLLATVLGVSQLVQPFATTFKGLVGDRLTGYVTGELIRATNRWQGVARFEDPSFADDLQRAREHAARGGIDLVMYGSRAALNLFTSGGLMVLLAGLHPLAPVIVVAATVPAMGMQWRVRDLTGSHIYVQTPEARHLEYARQVLVEAEQAKDVRLFGLGGFFRRRYDRSFDQAVGELGRLRWRMTPPMAAANGLAAAAVGAVFVYAVWGVAHGQGGVGDLVLYGGAATMLNSNLLMIGFDIGFFPLVLSYLPSLFRVFDAGPDLPQRTHCRPLPRAFREGIAFEDVWFTYPGQDRPALAGVSLAMAPGESLALVGHNGSGKTTLVKLLLRLYDPDRGRILLDGHDLRDYDLNALRGELGVIFQDFARYEFTAAENIGLGRLDHIDDLDFLQESAHRSGADDVIAALPEGLATRVGREFGGRELSGGEWQKLALARAFARGGQLLVLDEPTAALDPPTEYAIFQRFAELTRDRMTVLVSHRFSTVRMANRIILLDNGSIREQGSHDELIAAEGEYARLYRVQASQYLDEAGGRRS
jgi:ATP-binding cassette, subfamily B, bacterial